MQSEKQTRQSSQLGKPVLIHVCQEEVLGEMYHVARKIINRFSNRLPE